MSFLSRRVFNRIGLAAAVSGFAARRPACAADPITVAAFPVEQTAEPYYADAEGYFQAAGLSVEIVAVPNSAAMIAGVVSNSVRFANINAIAFAQATGNGIPLVVVAPSITWDDVSSKVVVAKSAGVHSARDLNGKTIGVAVLKNIPSIVTQYWVDKSGGDSSSLKFIELGFAQMVPSLQAGRIDAAFLVEPYLTLAKDEIRPLTNSLLPGLPRPLNVGMWVAAADWAKANPSTVAAFSQVILKTAQFANANHARTAVILAQIAKVNPDAVASMARIAYATGVEAGRWQPLLDLAQKYAGLPPTDLSRFLFRS